MPTEPVNIYSPDVLLGYGRPFSPIFFTPEQLQSLLIDSLAPVRILEVAPDGDDGLINVYRHSEESALADVEVVQFNSHYGLAGALGRNLESLKPSNTSAVTEPSMWALLFLSAAGLAPASPKRRHD